MSKQDCMVIVQDNNGRTLRVVPEHSKYLSKKEAQREAADALDETGVHRCVIVQKVMDVNQASA